MTGNPPVDVQAFGQSIWYDNIRRSLLDSGEMQRMVDEDGVLGVTSNPTIFQKAIGGSADYDSAIKTMLDLNADDIYEQLAVDDIQRALDILRPVYDRTNGRDGYVSLEVSPLIAHDTETTANEAKRLFKVVGRPNVMIKIPATEEGIPAIEEAIAAGVNVNVTLIFGIANYLQVTEAFIRGLERRLAAGEDVSRIASVASFFLSRIDNMVDQVLDNNIKAVLGRDVGRVSANNRLKGKAAIANAKIAYKRFMEIFYGERFAALRAAGAQNQRLLWASTSTKNPAYPDTMYLDLLIGKDTVNTVPPDTLKAFKDHGTAKETLIDGLDEAEQVMDQLAEVGIKLDQVTQQLQVDGVESFSDSFRSLMDQVDAKRNVLATGVIQRQDIAVGAHSGAVAAAIKDLDAQNAAARICEKDGTLWKDNPQVVAKIENRLGWLETDKTIDLDRLKALQAATKDAGITSVVLLGMGGSSLAPEVLYRTFGPQPGFPRLLMLDSTDPTYIASIEKAVDLAHTLFIVASKSGGTIETDSFFRYFYEQTGRKSEQFIAITDPGSPLAGEAEAAGFREIFLNPADIGGRYSALSYFGMVPAALMGLDLDQLWASASRMMKACGPNISGSDHPGVTLGAVLATLAQKGDDKVAIQTSPSINSLGNWIEQLIAESTGKEGRGILPVVGATVGKPHDYATDRVFVYVRVDGDDNAETDAGIAVLQGAGQPIVTILLEDKVQIGGEFYRWEFATAVAGKVLGINPFDEPNVTESKQNTARLLQHYQEHGSLPQRTPLLSERGVALIADERNAQLLREQCQHHGLDPLTVAGLLAAFINGTAAGDYLALLAYIPMFDAHQAVLEDIRRRMRHVTRRATTLGYGPRYLHSTGQFHKGGANNGVFLQITWDDPVDLAIPGRPYSFGVLFDAQSDGDLEALETHGRRVVRLHAGADVAAALGVLSDSVELAASRRL
ncbi:MAG TPA: bifunctional transaldolase/phosoglucose isomerase [Candidatus Limnocylindrales bacterium]|nr:bifunctional transaldolase/phosoglucose isomerase [Candidatus Limnocylindrales bacterium]